MLSRESASIGRSNRTRAISASVLSAVLADDDRRNSCIFPTASAITPLLPTVELRSPVLLLYRDILRDDNRNSHFYFLPTDIFLRGNGTIYFREVFSRRAVVRKFHGNFPRCIGESIGREIAEVVSARDSRRDI